VFALSIKQEEGILELFQYDSKVSSKKLKGEFDKGYAFNYQL